MSSAPRILDFPGAVPDICADDGLTLVPPGVYEIAFSNFKIKKMFSRDCLVVFFHITTFGEHFEKTLPRYYNCQKVGPRSVTAGPKSNLFREYVTVSERVPQKRRIPVGDFKDKTLIGRVVTVTTDRDQDSLHRLAQYSKVEKILRVAEK